MSDRLYRQLADLHAAPIPTASTLPYADPTGELACALADRRAVEDVSPATDLAAIIRAIRGRSKRRVKITNDDAVQIIRAAMRLTPDQFVQAFAYIPEERAA